MNRGRAPDRSPATPPDAGWTFIEIMVAMAIVAILLALAVPSYRQYLQRAHRAEAVQALMQVTACQERVRAATGYYDTTRCIGQPPGNGYRITIEPAGVFATPVFKAVAAPARPAFDDGCGELTIDQSGRRAISGPATRLGGCWGGR
ncbi:MAG: type IV pilin protein [Xanthomonadales bacterium]